MATSMQGRGVFEVCVSGGCMLGVSRECVRSVCVCVQVGCACPSSVSRGVCRGGDRLKHYLAPNFICGR